MCNDSCTFLLKLSNALNGGFDVGGALVFVNSILFDLFFLFGDFIVHLV